MHRRQFIPALLVFAVTTASVWGADRESNQSKLAKSFGGNEGMRILTSAEKVEARRIGDVEDQHSVKDYPLVGEPIELKREIAQKFATILSDHKSYDWSDAAKGCIPIYGVRLHFSKGKSNLDVVFCFHCDILLTYLDGKAVGAASFDNAHDELAKLMKELFPKDKGIQAIRFDADANKAPTSSDKSAGPRRIKL
jgi:hypothetical protein